MQGKAITIHVGTVKTGSTAIQKYLWENRDWLLTQGVDYLQVTPSRLDLPRYANADFLFDPATVVKSVRAMIDASPAPRIVISEERLWAATHAITHPTLDGYDKTIVLYLRNSADLIASWAGEMAEPYNSGVAPPADFPPEFQTGPLVIETGIIQCRYFYRKIFTEFLAFLDPFLASGGRLIVRPYARDQLTGQDAIFDFLAQVGITPETTAAGGGPPKSLRANPSRRRKFCDISALVWEIAKTRGDEALYDLALVEAIHARCLSGDDRSIAATLTDDRLAAIADEFEFIERELSARVNGGAPILASKASSVFRRPRPMLVRINRQEVERHYAEEITQHRDPVAVADLDAARKALAVTLAERDQARQVLAATLTERDHARRYPWKYLRHALAQRRARHPGAKRNH